MVVVKSNECPACILHHTFTIFALVKSKCPHTDKNVKYSSFSFSSAQFYILMFATLTQISLSYAFVPMIENVCKKGTRTCLMILTEFISISCGNVFLLGVLMYHKYFLLTLNGWNFLLLLARKYNIKPLITLEQFQSMKFKKRSMNMFVIITFIYNITLVDHYTKHFTTDYFYCRFIMDFSFTYLILNVTFLVTQKHRCCKMIVEAYLKHLKKIINNQIYIDTILLNGSEIVPNKFFNIYDKLDKIIRFNLLIQRTIMLDKKILCLISLLSIPVLTYTFVVIFYVEVCEWYDSEQIFDKILNIQILLFTGVMIVSLIWILRQHDLTAKLVS